MMNLGVFGGLSCSVHRLEAHATLEETAPAG